MGTIIGNTMSIIDRIEKLPTLPAVLMKVIETAENENSTAADLNKIISRDQALTGQILKLANSAYYGFPRSITKITEAVVIMGFKTVKGLCLSATVCSMFKSDEKVGNFSPRELWRHSVAVGICAEVIAKRIRSKMVEELFTLGILHDMGILMVMEFLKEDFVTIQTKTELEQRRLSEVEKEIIGMDHGLIGKSLSQKWKIPKLIGDVIGFHHTPQYAFGDAKEMAAIIYLANLICELKKIGHDGEYIIPPLAREPFLTLGLEKNDIKPVADQMDQEMAKAQEFLKLVDN
ncbi:MAG: HDOD domain-containing protein [Candidatus Wallbacteria bacterium]|nr:HDOD domain-containing protein [Candidatus Wallbacteria bacterium]